MMSPCCACVYFESEVCDQCNWVKYLEEDEDDKYELEDSPDRAYRFVTSGLEEEPH